MIRINLLKQLQPKSTPSQLVEAGKKSNRKVLIYAALVVLTLVAVAVIQFPTQIMGMFNKGQTVAQVEPAKPEETLDTLKPKKVTANAVEETVRDLNDQSADLVTPPSYSELVPSQKIEFQYYAFLQALKNIKAATPPEVGYANYIFTPPGDFYLHGLASNEENYQSLKKGLSGMQNVSVQSGVESATGAHGLAKEFSFYGSFKFPLSGMAAPPDHVIPKDKLQSELAGLKSVGANLGIKFKEPHLMGTVAVSQGKRMVYSSSAECSFQQMQDFLNDLHQAKSNLGITKLFLHASGDDKIIAEVNILAYVN